MKNLAIVMVVIVCLGAIVTVVYYPKLEQNQLRDMTQARLSDAHVIAQRIELFYKQTGQYPLQAQFGAIVDAISPGETPHELVVPLASRPFDTLMPTLGRPGFEYERLEHESHVLLVSVPRDHIYVSPEILQDDITNALGSDALLPTEHQKVSSGSQPTFYTYTLRKNGDMWHYVVTVFLTDPVEHATLMPSGVYKYEISSVAIPNTNIRVGSEISQ